VTGKEKTRGRIRRLVEKIAWNTAGKRTKKSCIRNEQKGKQHLLMKVQVAKVVAKRERGTESSKSTLVNPAINQYWGVGQETGHLGYNRLKKF